MQLQAKRFSLLPPVVKNLLIINGLFFLLDLSGLLQDQGFDIKEHLALFHWDSAMFRPWQLVSHLFLHASFGHLAINMFELWMFGYTLENVWGSKRFLQFYALSGIGAAVLYLITKDIQLSFLIEDYMTPDQLSEIYNIKFGYHPVQEPWQSISEVVNVPTLGASGAVFAILVAFGMMYPNQTVLIYFMIPMKIKYMMAILILIELYQGFFVADNIAHFAHLSGALFGYLLIRFWKKKGYLY
ncbi:MAG: rhomboid family intramembrane serine protease [Flavobacteriales bacterium]